MSGPNSSTVLPEASLATVLPAVKQVWDDVPSIILMIIVPAPVPEPVVRVSAVKSASCTTIVAVTGPAVLMSVELSPSSRSFAANGTG